MNTNQALKRGYEFTGIYTRNKEEAKLRAKKERQKGSRACVVTDTYKGRIYSTTGYSVYIKEKK